MEKRTLKFHSLIDMAMFGKLVSNGGYLMNTNNFTVTGKFTNDEVKLAVENFKARIIETNDKVFSYLS